MENIIDNIKTLVILGLKLVILWLFLRVVIILLGALP